jgi:hypothetical protein
MNILEEVKSILKNEIAERHTFYQLRFFVVGSEPTNQAKLQCCLRELKSRNTTLQSIQLEIDEIKDNKTLLLLDLDELLQQNEEDYTEREKIEKMIGVRKLQRKLISLEKQLVDLERKQKYVLEECQFFIVAFREIEKIEPLRNFDELDVQKEYWEAKLGREFRTKLIIGQNIDHELIKAIDQLHDNSDLKMQIKQLIEKRQQEMPSFKIELEDKSEKNNI